MDQSQQNPPPPDAPENAIAYWEMVGPRLEAEIRKRLVHEVDQALLFSIAFYSCVQETFQKRATKHQDWLWKLSPVLYHAQDVLRGTLAGYRDQSPVTLASMHRIGLEERINMAFILRSTDPAKYADLWYRYLDVERFIYESNRPDPTLSMLSPGERDRILKNCPEWIQNDKVPVKHWTADPALKQLRTLAEKVEMLDDYLTMYSLTSKFVHGSSILKNAYRAGCLGLAGDNACQSLLACQHPVRMLLEMADFFAVPYQKDDHAAWGVTWLQAHDKVKGTL